MMVPGPLEGVGGEWHGINSVTLLHCEVSGRKDRGCGDETSSLEVSSTAAVEACAYNFVEVCCSLDLHWN